MKSKDYYWFFQNKLDAELKAPGKWTRDLQTSDIEFNVYFKNLKGICKENKLREFYFKFLHRIIVTKKELCLYGIESNSACVYCQESDSISHSFIHCRWSKQFFSEVIKGAASRFVHLEKFSLNFSSSSFAIRVNFLHP